VKSKGRNTQRVSCEDCSLPPRTLIGSNTIVTRFPEACLQCGRDFAAVHTFGRNPLNSDSLPWIRSFDVPRHTHHLDAVQPPRRCFHSPEPRNPVSLAIPVARWFGAQPRAFAYFALAADMERLDPRKENVEWEQASTSDFAHDKPPGPPAPLNAPEAMGAMHAMGASPRPWRYACG
jgi:hypothetical protein